MQEKISEKFCVDKLGSYLLLAQILTMKSFPQFNKILVFLMIFSLTFGPVSSALAQSTTGQIMMPSPNINANRVGGGSFGSKEEKGISGLPGVAPMPGGQVFQEPVYSGLTYQVHILGEVNKPGTYRVSASTRLSEALERAGKILDRGSERRIELRRKEGGSRKVDILSFQLFGNLDANPYLLDNDVIFVPLKDKVVQIAGAVKRPNMYELLSEKTIEDVIHLAGGTSPGFGEGALIKLVRFEEGKKKVLEVQNTLESRKEFQLKNADAIVIPHILTKDKKFDYNLAALPGDSPLFYPSYDERVFVLGAVGRPGPLPFSPYYGVRQYLTLAGGTTKLAKSRKVKIINADGKTYKATSTININPGDTIVVPEKYLPPEGILSLVLGTTATVLGLLSTILAFTRR